MSSIALLGFADSESERLAAGLGALDPSLKLVKFTADTSKDELASSVEGALVWGAGTGLAGPAGIVHAAADAGVPVVAVLQVVGFEGINAAREEIEVCFLPCTSEEILLRLSIAMSKTAPTEVANMIIHGDLVIDCDRYEVVLKGRKVDLTYKEYELLKYLASNPGRVFSRESLLRSVWEYDYFGGTRTVDVHIRRLRSKIDDMSNHFIETQWNVGYRFRPPGRAS
ncbi:MAG: winged helix-turn-helix domain-containing protein [Chloroflexi bacterium]|nr:winged helix-turn-helix domain-containing protein [Chloroflexota bacterium]MDA1281385.1 winged helix-turn-helix domain-containing protein [Chloroflexota bacterium]